MREQNSSCVISHMRVTSSFGASVLPLLLEERGVEPHLPILFFVDDRGGASEVLTSEKLKSGAEGVAYELRNYGVHAGDRVILAYPPSLDFIKEFIGCLFAGVVPVPLCPPNLMRLDVDVARVSAIADNCDASLILTSTRFNLIRKNRLLSSRVALSQFSRHLKWHCTHRASPAPDGSQWHNPEPNILSLFDSMLRLMGGNN
jgi:non-ribosomal peptide synthetase component E (peptide arylation enzyme)